MRFALVDGQRREPESGLVGECTGCGSPVLARCGDVRVWHWAHKGRRRGHPWWENETEWHRRWKGHFPEDWQEVTHFRTLLFLGDLSLLGATTCAVFLPQSWLFPEGLVSLSSVLSEWIFRTLANGLGG